MGRREWVLTFVVELLPCIDGGFTVAETSFQLPRRDKRYAKYLDGYLKVIQITDDSALDGPTLHVTTVKK